MQGRQLVFGGILAAVLVFGGGASQAGSHAPVAGTVAQLDRQRAAMFEGLHNWRNAALDVAFDVFGALIAQVKQL
jgi:hypothetical protein